MIVMKFGGTSVESAEAIARVARIVRDRRDVSPLVVVSAMGKTTNSCWPPAESRRRELAAAHRDSSKTCASFTREARSSAEAERSDALVDQHFAELTDLAKGLAVPAR